MQSWEAYDRMDKNRVRRCLSNLQKHLSFGDLTQNLKNGRDSHSINSQKERALAGFKNDKNLYAF